ncbi:MAG: radical SAM protein [Nitrospirota bacterium]|nr:radical SAM protein [Nitrospirota bacterium]
MIEQFHGIAKDLTNDINREISSFRVRGLDSMLFLTYRCTSRCKTCNIWKRNAEKGLELDWREWNIVLERLRDYGIKTVEIFGGDALLRKDIIFKMIRFCTENDIRTYFPTNSILMDRETAEGLVNAGLDTIYFSLDAIDLESDKVRGVSGTFQKIKKAIESVVDARKGSENPKIIICSTLSNINYESFESIVDFLKDYPVDAVYPRLVTEFSQHNIDSSVINEIRPDPYFVTSEDKSHLFSLQQTRRFHEIISRLKSINAADPYINFQGIDFAPDEAFTCGEYGFRRCLGCSTLVTINPNGDVTPCPFYPKYVIGNLCQGKRLDEVWGNFKHREFIRLQRRDKIMICSNCVMPTFYPAFPNKLRYYLKRTGEKVSNLI